MKKSIVFFCFCVSILGLTATIFFLEKFRPDYLETGENELTMTLLGYCLGAFGIMLMLGVLLPLGATFVKRVTPPEKLESPLYSGAKLFVQIFALRPSNNLNR